MTEQELALIYKLPNSAIIAPAGHGKTEMIVELVDHLDGRQLLLTHTNAGVDALQKRLQRKNVSKTKYSISTIAAFCIKWGMSYYNSAQIDKSLSPYNRNEASRYYNQFYNGASLIFDHDWVRKVLQNSYTGIIVDEYQDCNIKHHEIFHKLNRYLPVRVLGDPLQGIFSFTGQPLVDWDNLGFNIVDVKTRPWRWNDVNPELGEYLQDIRRLLLPTLSGQICGIDFSNCPDCVCLVDPDDFNPYRLLPEFKQYKSVLYIAKWPREQLNFCNRKMPGIFQYDEKQECDELFEYSDAFSKKTGFELALSIIAFESECLTKVNSELASYINRLKSGNDDYSRIKKHQDFGELLHTENIVCPNDFIIAMLEWFEQNQIFKFYRKELHCEMLRSVKYARNNGISISDAAGHIRSDVPLQKRYTQFKYLSSRTLLSKGLEFDCVLVDMSDPLSAKEFYVAITRAMKKVYIITSSSLLKLKP